MKKIILTAALLFVTLAPASIFAKDPFKTPMSEFDGLNITQAQREKLYEATVQREEAIENNMSTIDVGQFAAYNERVCEEAQIAFLKQVQSILTQQQYQQYIDSMPLAVQVVSNF